MQKEFEFSYNKSNSDIDIYLFMFWFSHPKFICYLYLIYEEMNFSIVLELRFGEKYIFITIF